jgi:hypothetical protein
MIMIGILLYLVIHSRRRTSEIISRLDEHHQHGLKEQAKMKVEVFKTTKLTQDIHQIISHMTPRRDNTPELDDFLKTDRLRHE